MLPVPSKPYGFCGLTAPLKKEDSLTCLTPSCLRRDTARDRIPGRLGLMNGGTKPNTITLSPLERFCIQMGTDGNTLFLFFFLSFFLLLLLCLFFVCSLVVLLFLSFLFFSFFFSFFLSSFLSFFLSFFLSSCCSASCGSSLS